MKSLNGLELIEITGEGEYPKLDGDPQYASEFNGYAGILVVEAGETITQYDVVYINTSDGKAYVSDLATAGDRRASGIALEGAAAAANVTLQTKGLVQNLTGLTAGTRYYLGNAGALTATANNVFIGIATSTTQLQLTISASSSSVSDIPVGTIMPWAKTLTGVPALPSGWVECDGSVLSDAESPLNGQTIPNLNGSNYFLRGASTSGGTGGAATVSHNHIWAVSANTDKRLQLQADSNDGINRTAIADGSMTQDLDTSALATAYTDNASVAPIPPYYSVVFIMKVK